ncbi:amino acid ABC transporter substrate-binding protein [Neobacillus vireti]|uniref:Amino acid ABC transporter amino acid-binding protein n=1 Tax=Neobacillus vireti LMG 21834 TaxID=1131730 RepID=A0AB94IMS3_9BACI|nr:amino acid ABC transporter substrate-binding protein [Neobacillus vireti]ETI68354.1 amino acid ABC transporter amino acid-binding protein [Neobacillus vireti LMG 21834]KLT16308.1 amino acid ABC transporter substrate-binding protein [Neobacillus vireti]
MKRLVSIVLVIAAVFSVLTACSNNTSGDKEKDDQTLIIGIDDKFAPLGFRDDANNIVGFDIDYAKAAAEKMGMKVKFQPINWKTKESELSSGRIDLIWNGYTITDERKKKVLFTKPYLKNAQVVVTLADSKVSKLADLEGKRVGLQSLSSASDALDANPIKSKIKDVTEFSDNVMALNDLKSGRLDAVVIDEVVIDYYMTKEQGTFKVLNESLAPEEYGVGVKKGNEELLNKLQKALDKMNEDGTAAEISNKWFGEDKVVK